MQRKHYEHEQRKHGVSADVVLEFFSILETMFGWTGDVI